MSASARGSSPLARGLPQGFDEARVGGRIIPARAGFTDLRAHRRPRGPDHPRSRGVYSLMDLLASSMVGSSPLARGLRCHFRPGRRRRWIIPARAGFTLRGRLDGRGRPDHPRSRGVYRGGCSRALSRLGSSPLARGLPHPSRWGASSSSDHPRSRGVYRPRARPGRRRPGSSPLARGLRPCPVYWCMVAGIIPARAGFTAESRGNHEGARDHPRSRGVYPRAPPLIPTHLGSSPLARGLPWVTLSIFDCGRIIPARAGFTWAAARAGR